MAVVAAGRQEGGSTGAGLRIVLDTNVIVSGLLNDAGVPAQVIDLCIAGEFGLLVDTRILAEYRDVLRRPELALDAGDVEGFLSVMRYAEYVVAAPLPLSLPDPDDLPFLEVAIAAGADALVTANARHFRAAEGNVDIPVLTPRRFIDRLGGR